jgi:N-terminal domain on NACHT_NTPase and P-loop NTPases
MAEALAAIGLVSAIVQFVEFGTKIIGRFHSLQKEVADGPKVFQDVRTRLPLMLDLVKKIRIQIEAGQVDKASQEVMLPVIQTCLVEVRHLDDLFVKALPKCNDSSWNRGKKAIISVIRESEIARIDLVLKTNCDLLVQSGTFLSMSRLGAQEPSSLQQMVNVIIPPQQNLSTSEYEYVKRSDSMRVSPVFMVPFQRDPKFLGRQSTINEIKLRFNNQRQVALAGLGGVG